MKLFIGICNSQHHVPAEFFWSFIAIRKPVNTPIFRSRHPWDIVRNNVMIVQFLKSDCDVFAKMDIDQSYPVDYFERLLPLVEKYKVAGPIIYDRWHENNFMPLAFDQVNENNFPVRMMDTGRLSGVVEIPFPHTNLLYSREVLERVQKPWYQAYFTPDGCNRMNHVDYTFIDKIHKAGYKIMIDTDCVVGHESISYVGKPNGK